MNDRWQVEKELEQPARIVEIGLGRWHDERRTVCVMAANSEWHLAMAHEIVRCKATAPPLPLGRSGCLAYE